MLEFQLTLTDGTRHRARFTNEEIVSNEIARLINFLDLLDKVGKNCNSWNDIKGVYVQGGKPVTCDVHLEELKCLEYIEFQRGLTGIKKVDLPQEGQKYRVVNVPLCSKYLFCSRCAYITNFDELLESDVNINMNILSLMNSIE